MRLDAASKSGQRRRPDPPPARAHACAEVSARQVPRRRESCRLLSFSERNRSLQAAAMRSRLCATCMPWACPRCEWQVRAEMAVLDWWRSADRRLPRKEMQPRAVRSPARLSATILLLALACLPSPAQRPASLSASTPASSDEPKTQPLPAAAWQHADHRFLAQRGISWESRAPGTLTQAAAPVERLRAARVRQRALLTPATSTPRRHLAAARPGAGHHRSLRRGHRPHHQPGRRPRTTPRAVRSTSAPPAAASGSPPTRQARPAA